MISFQISFPTNFSISSQKDLDSIPCLSEYYALDVPTPQSHRYSVHLITQLMQFIATNSGQFSESCSEIPQALQRSLASNNIINNGEGFRDVIQSLNRQLEQLQQQIIENQISSTEFYTSFNKVCDSFGIPAEKESVRLQHLQNKLEQTDAEMGRLAKITEALKAKVQELSLKNAELEVKYYAQSLGTENILQTLGLSRQ